MKWNVHQHLNVFSGMHGFPFAKVSNEKSVHGVRDFNIQKRKESLEIFLLWGLPLLLCRSIWNIWPLERTVEVLFCVEKVSNLRPIIIAGARVFDFSITWFWANHFIKSCQKQEVLLQAQNKWIRVSFMVPQKKQILFSLKPIFLRKSFVAGLLWSSLNGKIINLVTFVLQKGSLKGHSRLHVNTPLLLAFCRPFLFSADWLFICHSIGLRNFCC